MSRPPLPPFTAETAAQKARMAEDAWNTREPARVAQAYTVDSRWRNRAEFLQGREAIEAFLTRKWARELDYRLIKEVWAFQATGSPCASPTSGTTTVDSGIAATATRTGSSTMLGSCECALPASMIVPIKEAGAQISLASRTASRRSSLAQRSRIVRVFTRQRVKIGSTGNAEQQGGRPWNRCCS